MNKTRRFSSFIAAAAVAMAVLATGCANRPESIAASYVSHERYTEQTCDALNTKLADTRSDLEKASSDQNTKANVDAIGVFLLGIPFSKLSGDREGDIARLKGEVQAIETAQVKQKCKSI